LARVEPSEGPSRLPKFSLVQRTAAPINLPGTGIPDEILLIFTLPTLLREPLTHNLPTYPVSVTD
jgi:hypothetical protein